eukprot:SAG22_NODE_72_length_22344_cov_95.586559_1_plen_185_part_10
MAGLYQVEAGKLALRDSFAANARVLSMLSCGAVVELAEARCDTDSVRCRVRPVVGSGPYGGDGGGGSSSSSSGSSLRWGWTTLVSGRGRLYLKKLSSVSGKPHEDEVDRHHTEQVQQVLDWAADVKVQVDDDYQRASTALRAMVEERDAARAALAAVEAERDTAAGLLAQAAAQLRAAEAARQSD